MARFLIFFALLLTSTIALAQSPLPEPKPPEQVEIVGEQFTTLKISELRARLAISEAETLDARIQTALLQIQQAQRDLQALKQKAKDEQARHQAKVAELGNIPADKLSEYEPSETTDKLILKRKTKP